MDAPAAGRRDPRRQPPTPPAGDTDRGSAMILVLVLMVIGALVVLPILGYASTVMRANTVLSQKTVRAEAVKAGFRMAMAEPAELYEACGAAGLNVGVTLPSPGMSVETETRCYLLDVARAQEDFELPFALATTYAGSGPETGAGVTGTAYPGPADPSNESSWLADTTVGPTAGRIWMPNLPVHALSLRTSTGRPMPPEYVVNGFPSCAAFFPGTYKQPVVLDGPTYFTSGIYYFEKEVRIAAGAQVVAGQGASLGCADDQLAAFYATGAPATHNINGLGVTFVFGDEGRLVVDDSAGPVSFTMNQRYVAPGDVGVASSSKVSIMTVNGDLDPALVATDFDNSGTPLFVAGKIAVPLSLVGSDTTREAPYDDYRPSVLTPEPRVPTAPTAVTIVRTHNGAVTVGWQAPSSTGGPPITSYTVTSSPGDKSCVATELLSCSIVGLTNGTSYTFTVVATNEIGNSKASDPSPSTVPSSSMSSITPPGNPTNIRITQRAVLPLPKVSRFKDAFEISWDAPANPSGSPVLRYDLALTDGTSNWTCQTTTKLSCAIAGLSGGPLTKFDVSVTATNLGGTSAAGTYNNLYLDPLGEQYVAPPPPPPASTAFTPDPVVDIRTTTANAVTVQIPGYVSVPQGLVRVTTANPAGKSVALEGGVLAAWTVVDEPRPSPFTFGILNPATQRKIRIVTRTTSGPKVVSDAVVQINQTGGWAVNSWEVQAN